MASTASTNPDPKEAKSIFEFAAEDINGKPFSFQTLEGKVVMIVNTAGQCGLAQRNFTEMVELHDKYKDQGFEIVAFPSNSFNQIAVNGSDTHPLYTYLKGASPGWLTNSLKWNFTKFLCDRTGVPRKRFGPQEAPSTMATDIE
ncbi:uncharacterized protein MONBRDRAFT_27890 [Monosiga brevicollis MX1]|uniref:Glutathione peroxidase n=1 Tax=Monosiga brevicollis TaxID=81824 RepID=A9V6S1_MONBE|nr:uncharacterized protein MONBRDRAFT_27890 [Monosiga brevicollis MX1]EDQ86783.1 predicted protein [Monosiga brevicollis MX1]|eukprot:XP_001748328.1 hypothetical protein [Monosiga brevicollis MX1]